MSGPMIVHPSAKQPKERAVASAPNWISSLGQIGQHVQTITSSLLTFCSTMAFFTNTTTGSTLSENSSSSSSTTVSIYRGLKPAAQYFPIFANDPAVKTWKSSWKRRISLFLDDAGFGQWTCIPVRKGLDHDIWVNNSVCMVVYLEDHFSKSRRASLREAILTALLESDTGWSRESLFVEILRGALQPQNKVHSQTGSLVACTISKKDDEERRRTGTLTGTLKIKERGEKPECVLLSCHHIATNSHDALSKDSCLPVTRPCRTTRNIDHEIYHLESRLSYLNKKLKSGSYSYLEKPFKILNIWRYQKELEKKKATQIPPSEQIGSTGASSGLHRVLLTHREETAVDGIRRDPGILDWLIIKPNRSLQESNVVTISNKTSTLCEVRPIAHFSERTWLLTDKLNKSLAAVYRVGGVNGRTSLSRGFLNGVRALSRGTHSQMRGFDDVEGGQEPAFFYEDWIVIPEDQGELFSRDGDSGSLVLVANELAVVGMLTAGPTDNRFSVIQDMGDVLDDIKEKLNAEEVVFAGCRRMEEGL